ncbi:MAG: hypothetical protein ABSC94_10000 [Polyangiaceae bacterium]|jgi:hypothetical protein
MPVPFAHLGGFALGAALAWVAAPELASSESPVVASRSFAIVLTFALAIWVPIVGYFVAFHGDWSYLYLVPWRRVPSAVDLGLVLLAGAAVLGGFVCAVPAVRKRRFAPVVGLVAIPGGLAVGGLSVVARRLALSGTYSQFHGDFGTVPIAASLLGRGVLFMGVVLVLGITWTVRMLAQMAAEASAEQS